MADVVYVCRTVIDNACMHWVELDRTGFFEQFNQLTLSDVSAIIGATALLFGVAWVMNWLSKFIKENYGF